VCYHSSQYRSLTFRLQFRIWSCPSQIILMIRYLCFMCRTMYNDVRIEKTISRMMNRIAAELSTDSVLYWGQHKTKHVCCLLWCLFIVVDWAIMYTISPWMINVFHSVWMRKCDWSHQSNTTITYESERQKHRDYVAYLKITTTTITITTTNNNGEYNTATSTTIISDINNKNKNNTNNTIHKQQLIKEQQTNTITMISYIM